MNAPNFFLASVHLDILYLKQTPKLYNFNWGAWTDTVHLPPNLSVSEPKHQECRCSRSGPKLLYFSVFEPEIQICFVTKTA